VGLAWVYRPIWVSGGSFLALQHVPSIEIEIAVIVYHNINRHHCMLDKGNSGKKTAEEPHCKKDDHLSDFATW
jgi:hypothetical protein